MRISLPIIIQVRSGIRAPSSPTGHQHNFTLSYPVTIKQNVIQLEKKKVNPKDKLILGLKYNSTNVKCAVWLINLRNIPTPAPQVAAWAVQAPTSSPSSWLRQQELWEHSIAPQKRHKVGCFLSSSVDFGHLRTWCRRVRKDGQKRTRRCQMRGLLTYLK